ncbi:SAM-dependent methyltransferase [Kutzneria albida]|nr:class I SAM-dependent methyltransferase [Kutzneria albida]
MDRELRGMLAHADHPISAPVNDANVHKLMARAVVAPDSHVLDLGCGTGTWLQRLLAERPGTTGVGVDSGPRTVEAARRSAEELGLADRLTLHCLDAKEYRCERRADAVFCVGATHAFGGLRETVLGCAEHLAEGGTMLIGDGFWERPPGEATLRALDCTAEEYRDLHGTVELVEKLGWQVVYAHTSTLDEWDDYEWNWTGSLTRWALTNPGHEAAADALEEAARHRTAWLNGYRGTLGFVTMLLMRND